METDDTRLPWERSPDETSVAFEAFARYRDAGADRSQRAVARTLGKSGALIGRWSTRHSWVTRAEAFDTAEDRKWRADMAARRRKAVERHLRMAELAQSKIGQRLIDLDPSTLSASDLARLFDVVVRIEREALGEPQRHEISGPGGNPVQVQVQAFADLPPAQRRQAITDLVETVQRRRAAAGGIADDDE